MMHTFKFAEISGYPDYLKRAVEELKKFRDCIITPAALIVVIYRVKDIVDKDKPEHSRARVLVHYKDKEKSRGDITIEAEPGRKLAAYMFFNTVRNFWRIENAEMKTVEAFEEGGEA